MNTTFIGIGLKVLSVTIFTVLFSLVKATADEIPTGQQVFFRTSIALMIFMLIAGSQGTLWTLFRTTRLREHMFRSMAGCGAMTLKFTALGLLSFADVTALGFTTPLILTVLATVMLGEQVRAFRYTTVLVGFMGVLIVLWPSLELAGSSREMIGAAVILSSAGLVALAHVYVRKLVGTEATLTVVSYQALFITCMSLLTIPFGWVWPEPETWWMLIGLGVLGAAGQIAMTSSYRFANASLLAPFDYTTMLLAIFIGIVWFSEVPTLWTLVGSAVIIASGIVIIWRERQLAKNV